MEPNLDRFGGPAAWDAHCYEQDKRRKWELGNSTCCECTHCAIPDSGFKNKEHIGYCKYSEEFCCYDDVPAEIGCEEFSSF